VLRQLRMRRAAILLKSDHANIDQVAHATGYASRSSFLRAFRRVYGCDATEFRASKGSTPSDEADDARWGYSD
jgi:AraC-like DNA-binding protein